jgi:hypothetical protein
MAHGQGCVYRSCPVHSCLGTSFGTLLFAILSLFVLLVLVSAWAYDVNSLFW